MRNGCIIPHRSYTINIQIYGINKLSGIYNAGNGVIIFSVPCLDIPIEEGIANHFLIYFNIRIPICLHGFSHDTGNTMIKHIACSISDSAEHCTEEQLAGTGTGYCQCKHCAQNCKHLPILFQSVNILQR